MAAEVAKQFRVCSFRGIEFPVIRRTYGFHHEKAKDRFVQTRVEHVQALGRSNPTWAYDIPGIEELNSWRWANWFSKTYERFLDAFSDESEGELVDAINGPQVVQPVVWQDVLEASRPQGVAIHVEFVLSPPEDQLEQVGRRAVDFTTVVAQAGFLEKELAAALTPETRERLRVLGLQPPEPRLDLFGAIGAIGDQLTLASNRLSANVEDFVSRFDSMKNSFDRLGTETAAQSRLLASRLEGAARDISQAGRPKRPVTVVQVARPGGRVAVAAAYKMSATDLLDLNPQIAGEPTIAAGTSIVVYR